MRPYRIGIVLLIATLLYNVAEGALSIYSGLRAGSLVLISFGADSYLEVLATGAVLWRLSYRDEEAGRARGGASDAAHRRHVSRPCGRDRVSERGVARQH